MVAADNDAMNLIVFSMHQHNTAVAAGVINGVTAGLKDRRGVYHVTDTRRLDDFEWNALV